MYRLFHHFTPRIATMLVLFELLIFVGAAYVATDLRFGEDSEQFIETVPNFIASAMVLACLTSLSMAAFGLYETHGPGALKSSLWRLGPAVLMGASLTMVAYYIIPELYLGRGVLFLAVMFGLTAIMLLRLTALQLFRSRFMKSRLLFLGASEQARECMRISSESGFAERYQVIGILPLHDDERSIEGAYLLPNQGTLLSIARKYRVDEIVVSLKNLRGLGVPVDELLQCKLNGVTVTPISQFFERELNKLRLNYLTTGSLVFSDGFQLNATQLAVKRVVDLLVASLLLVFSFPLMVLTTLAILLEDGGPVLYRQERVGRAGRPFTVLKFRSMNKDAESGGVPLWAGVGDQRATRVGRFIRKTRIDELPQLFNVLKGDMSFVGPRPERPYFVRQLSEQVEFYPLRHSIKPGLTGLAQVRYRYGATVDDSIEKLQYDLYYIKNQSLFLDLLIIVDTVQVVLFAKGSR